MYTCPHYIKCLSVFNFFMFQCTQTQFSLKIYIDISFPLSSSSLLLHSFPQPILPPVAVSSVDLERLERVERQLALLWERVQQGDQKQEQHRTDVLGLYSTLREQLHTQTDRESLGLWVSSLLEQRLNVLRGELEQENTHRAQVERSCFF